MSIDAWGQAKTKPVPAGTLYDAAEAGDLRRVNELLDWGLDVDGKSRRGKKAPLLVAVEKENAELVDLLIARGADVNYAAANGMPPLHHTIRRGHGELFQRLVEAGADIRKKGPGGWMPIHFAARYGRTGILTSLVEAGCNIDAKTPKGETPLHLALELTSPRIAEHIVDLGADVLAPDKDGVSPFEKVCRTRRMSLARKIISRVPADRPQYRLRILNKGLYNAFIQDFVDLERFLVDQGANLDIQVNERYSLLHYAAEYGFEDSLRFLLEKGADVNAATSEARWTPLHFACRNGHADVVRLLCEHGADPNVLDGMQRTPMHLAAWADDLQSAQELANRGADLNVVDWDGNTPLHYAAEKKTNRLVPFLVQRVTDLEAKNSQGRTALDVAMDNEHSGAIEILVEALAKKELEAASAFSKHVENIVLASLSDSDGNIEPDKTMTHLRRGDRPLHVVVREGSLPAARTILEADGSQAEARNKYGYLAIHLAADRGDAGLVALLVSHGAPPGDQGNPAKWSPLHFAASGGHVDVVEVLLDAGADAQARDGSGRTPLEIASDKGPSDVVPLLRKAARAP